MRLTAYKQLIDSAKELPRELSGASYFKTTKFLHDPRREAICAVLNKARKDIKALYIPEFIELYKYSQKGDSEI